MSLFVSGEESSYSTAKEFYLPGAPSKRPSSTPEQEQPDFHYSLSAAGRQNGPGNWSEYSGDQLTLSILKSTGHLVIMADKVVHECHSLVHGSQGRLKISVKEDVISLLARIDGERSIRVKMRFRDGANAAQDAGRELVAFMPVLAHDCSFAIALEDMQTSVATATSSTTKSIAESARVSPNALMPPLQMEQYIRLCLLDPTFPDFVAQVERTLYTILE